jgi:hypothetical protein
VHDLGDRVAVGLRRRNVGLRAGDPARGDELLRARDLLRRLDALDPSPKYPLPTASHIIRSLSAAQGTCAAGVRSLASTRLAALARAACALRAF